VSSAKNGTPSIAPNAAADEWIRDNSERLSGVTLEYPTDVSDEGLAVLSRARELRTLQIKGPVRISNAGWELLARCRGLERVVLWRMSVSPNALTALSRVGTLRDLELVECQLDNGQPLQRFTQVKNLRLSSSSWETGSLHWPAQGAAVEFVSADGSTLTDRELSRIGSMKELKLLDVSDTGVTGELVTTYPIRLETIWAANSGFSDAGVSRLKGHPSLRELDLRGTQISASAISHITKVTRLEMLNVRGTDLCASDLGALSELEFLSALSVPVSATGNDLLQLEQVRGLQFLFVGPDVSAGTLKRLRTALPNCDVIVED